MWTMHDGFGWWAVMGGFGMIAFWAAIIFLVVALTRERSSSRPEPREDPASIAGLRLARGEIDEAEYDRILAKLR